jgi:NodT family efflux transporter outer membrane factor (OMF) lipoprotein
MPLTDLNLNPTPRPPGLVRRAGTVLLAGAAAAALSACATVPRLGPAPRAKAPAAYETAVTFDAPAADWPQDRWWTAYNDPQLDKLIDEALAGAPTLAEAQARARQAGALAEQAGAALAPQVGVEASVAGVKQSYNQGIPSAFIPHGWRDAGRVAVGMAWDLDLFGRNRANLAAATSEAQAARAEAAETRLALSTSIAGAYAGLAQLYAERDAARDAVRVRTKSEELIDARVARGLETKAAGERAHSARAAAQAELAALDEAIGLTKNQIAALLGQGPDRGRAIGRPTPGAIHAFGLPANLPAELVGRRPDLVAARLTAEAASHRIRAAKADFYPDVNLIAVIGQSSLGLRMLTNSSSTFGQAGPAVTLPIFSGGRLEGAYRGARANYDLAVASYDQTLARALQEVADSVVSAQALDARLASSREALAAADTAYDLTRQRYARGLGTYLDVLSAEDALISEQRAVANLETRAFVLDVALIRALGGGYRA